MKNNKINNILCPSCEDHPMLSEKLACPFCGGRYVWKEKEDLSKN